MSEAVTEDEATNRVHDDRVHVIGVLAGEYERLHCAAGEVVRLTPAEKLYWQPHGTVGFVHVYSCGEHVLRSAGAVEQVFGGITANLWDDPFEWTLPETLRTPNAIIDYLEEVAATRRRGFALLASDADLGKRVATQTGETDSIGDLLTHTLVRAAHHLGCAYATFRLFSDARLPRL